LQGLLHDGGDDLALVDAFKSLSFLEQVLSSAVEVVLEGDLLGDEELREGKVTLRRVLLRMDK
jgi:hypothetical protein